MKWFKKKENKQDDSTKTVKCAMCEKMFDPFEIIVTKEGTSLCKHCFAHQEK